MKKERINKLIPIADRILKDKYNDVQLRADNVNDPDKKAKILKESILKKDANFYIESNYDGKISSLGITIAQSGLLPSLAIYFNESGEVKTRPILEAIAKIIQRDNVYANLREATARGLVDHALMPNTNLENLKKYVLEAVVALKLVVRTYEHKERN